MRLDRFLTDFGVGSRSAVRELIKKGRIRVNGEPCLARGKKLYPGDNFEYKNQRFTVTDSNADNEA